MRVSYNWNPPPQIAECGAQIDSGIFTKMFVDFTNQFVICSTCMDKTIKPTDCELAILRVLWQRGPSTVKEVHKVLDGVKRTGYTTVLKFMQIMVEKGLLTRDESTFAHVYQAKIPQEQAQRTLVANLLDRAFDGSMSRLVLQALATKRATAEELAEIRKILRKHERGE